MIVFLLQLESINAKVDSLASDMAEIKRGLKNSK